MTRWWWVRHGPTHEKAFTGWRDVPADLSDTDRIARLRAYLPKTSVLITSDLQRAITTGDAIADAHDRPAPDPALREFNFGAWDGLHFTEVAARDPELSRRYWEQPGALRAPDGESWNDVSDRLRPVVDRLNGEGHVDIIAVAHMGVILTQLQRATGKSAYDTLAQKIEPLSVTELIYSNASWTVGAVNHCP